MKPLLGSAALLAALISAKPMFDHATSLDAYRAFPHRDAGYRALRAGDVKTAIASFEEALRRDPRDAQSARGLIAALLDRKQLNEAGRQAVRLLALTPDDPLLHATVALADSPPGARMEQSVNLRDLQQLAPASAGPIMPLALDAPVAALPRADTVMQAYRIAAQAYEDLRAGRRQAAIANFQLAQSINPTAQTAADLGFVLAAEQDWQGARRALDQSVRLGNRSPAVRSQLALLDRRWQIQGYMVSRQNEPDRFRADRTLPGLGGSQAVVGLTWRLNDDPARPLNAGIRAASALASSSGSGTLASTQIVAGASLRPSSDINLVLAAERLIKAGRDSRNAWMLRTGWSTGTGLPIAPGQTSRWGWTLDAQAGVIGASSRDLFGGIDVRAGRSIAITPSMSVVPYLGVSSLAERTDGNATLVEAAPGVALRYEMPGGMPPLDARLDWRQRIAGNAAPANGLTFTVATQF